MSGMESMGEQWVAMTSLLLVAWVVFIGLAIEKFLL